MAKLQQLQRLLLIIRKLHRPQLYVSGEELQEYLQREMAIRADVAGGYSIRTIQRDIVLINNLFGIVIESKNGLGYHISHREIVSNDNYEELLLNFDILSILGADSGLCDYVLPEHHKAKGLEIMPYLMNAIRYHNPVEFDYTFIRHDNRISHKIINPYFLKESQHRWYLLGKDTDKLKIFALDRIGNLYVHEKKSFERETEISSERLFKDSFGIWDDPDIPVEDIILSYSPLDGAFLKTLPLHHSQNILIDNEKEFRIKVRLRITNDFVMELLSRSASLTVIEPLNLKKRLRDVYSAALRRNSE